MPKEHSITFDCDGDQLAGIIHDGVNGNDAVLVFVVGGPQYRVGSHRMFVVLARDLSALGPAVLRFDCRGMGDSDGEFVSFESISDDIRSAVDAVAARMPERRVVLAGLCDGASACAIYAPTDPRVSAMVLLNPWVRTESGEARARLSHYYVQRLRQWSFWKALFSGELNLIPSFVSLGSNVRRSLRGSELASSFVDRMWSGLDRFSGRVLIILSDADLTAQEFMVLVRGSPKWRDAMQRSTITLDSLEGADHTFSGQGELESVARRVLRFMDRER